MAPKGSKGIELMVISRSFTIWKNKWYFHAKMTLTFSWLPNSSQGFQRYRIDCHFKIFYNMGKNNIFMWKWRENEYDCWTTSIYLNWCHSAFLDLKCRELSSKQSPLHKWVYKQFHKFRLRYVAEQHQFI